MDLRLFSIVYLFGNSFANSTIGEPIAFLVESLPTGMDLSLFPGSKLTWEVQIDLVNNARDTLDISCMYWNLVAADLTDAEYIEFDAKRGLQLYQAFEAAAARGVQIRFLDGDGISSNNATQIQHLVDTYPDKVFVQLWNASEWYEGGIMHQKIWIADEVHIYIGSANMDWLSLTQVKEVGVVVHNSTTLGKDLNKLFNRWWLWTSNTTSFSDPKTVDVFDNQIQVSRRVPCWSQLAPPNIRCENPIDADPALVTYFNINQPMKLTINQTESTAFVSAAPMEVNSFQAIGQPLLGIGRTSDEEALAATILDAQHTVSLSVMDFLPSSLYSPPSQTIWWPKLFNALVTAATTKGIKVRLLISRWNHTSPRILPYLQSLVSTAQACHTEASRWAPQCTGTLEVRLFEVPGWNNTGRGGHYPAYSRVNHNKYVVTDRRIHITTSNMVWSYYHTTAGCSFNSDHAKLRSGLKAIFDRDWNSKYSIDLGC